MSANPPTVPTAPARLRRFACMMYEGVLLFGVVFVADYLFDTLTQSRSGLMLRHSREIFLFLAIGVYFVLCWRRGGQTLPMKTWNIRLTDRGGNPLRGTRLVLRYLLIWPLPLLTLLLVRSMAHALSWPPFNTLFILAPFSNFLWTWLDPQGQFLHDRLLGTELHDLKQPLSPPLL
ncbi:Putative RDD family membrane protein YckC OS=Castellaniella defragrans OX=75697 GN=HNR28_003091 PE=4 SV=1 [Castellaniella defragrans]